MPFSQSVPFLPGMPHVHFMRLAEPSGFCSGRAKNPGGWSLRQAFHQKRIPPPEEIIQLNRCCTAEAGHT
jgi:hypothetical protein